MSDQERGSALCERFIEEHRQLLVQHRQQLEHDRLHLEGYDAKLRTGILTSHEMAIDYHEQAIRLFTRARAHYLANDRELGDTELEQGEMLRHRTQRLTKFIGEFHSAQRTLLRTDNMGPAVEAGSRPAPYPGGRRA